MYMYIMCGLLYMCVFIFHFLTQYITQLYFTFITQYNYVISYGKFV